MTWLLSPPCTNSLLTWTQLHNVKIPITSIPISRPRINPFIALHSCSCISTRGMSISNHTSRVKALQLCEQTSQRLWLTRQLNRLVQQNHLKAVVATWCKYRGCWKLGPAPQTPFRHRGRKQRWLLASIFTTSGSPQPQHTLQSVPYPPWPQTELASLTSRI